MRAGFIIAALAGLAIVAYLLFKPKSTGAASTSAAVIPSAASPAGTLFSGTADVSNSLNILNSAETSIGAAQEAALAAVGG